MSPEAKKPAPKRGRAPKREPRERPRPRALRIPAVEILLPLACLASALVLGFSELLTTFELTPPGGEPLQVIEASDRHSYALLVLALFAIFALAVAAMSGSKAAAFAVAATGAVALLIFLLGDLPRAGQIGTLDDPRQSFIDAEAVPQAGFWLELLGALGLAVSGAALATLTPEQLSLGERWAARRRGRRPTGAAEPEPDAQADEASKDAKEPKSSPKRRRRATGEESRERVKDRVERVRRAASRRRGAD
ncbi:MAG TPA: hypothetical protein VFY99_01465 [Solirubrobacterales bacterium]